MKRIFITSLFIFFGCNIAFADVYNYSPFNYNAPKKMDSSTLSSSNLNHYSKIDNNYYSPSGTRYTRQGNDIYGSDGSHYTQYGNTIQNTAPQSNSYQINNNLIQPLY